MINEKKIRELEKRINTPNYSESLPRKKKSKPDTTKLKKLAREIRKTVEDYSIEPTAHSHTSGKA